MLSMTWATAPTPEPHLAIIPGSRGLTSCRGPGWDSMERWRVCSQGRAHGQDSRADRAVGKATVRPQLQDQTPEVCSAAMWLGSHPSPRSAVGPWTSHAPLWASISAMIKWG